MKRVLFVDDEPNILNGLKRTLRSMRHEWQMQFEESGPAALEAMKKEPFDIVISDMRMPGMDGAQLLSEVKHLYPTSIRIILSGHSEREMVLKSIGATHQYLSKPLDSEALKSTVERAFALRTLLENESIKEIVSHMGSLPSLPTLFQGIVQKLQDHHASLEVVGKIIAEDTGMGAKILQLVNSAYFGLARPMTIVERAVIYLGLETITSLVLSIKIFSQYDGPDMPGYSVESLWHHSVRTAVFARTVAQKEGLDKKVMDDSFMAGMLHDVGKLILATAASERYGRVLERVTHDDISLSEAEREELGATHAEVGAYLIGMWGLPDSIVEAIAYHHNPKESLGRGFKPLTAVHVANGLAREPNASDAATAAALIDLDWEYLKSLGIEDRLPVWREVCRAIAEEGDDR